MTALHDLRPEELTAVLVDVLRATAAEESAAARGELTEGPVVLARLAIHDTDGDHYALVEVRIGVALARVLAGRMLNVADPVPDDVLDAVAEVGNIAAGNVKSLLCRHARLSLPSAAVVEHPPPHGVAGVRGRAVVLGHVAELELTLGGPVGDLHWPPTAHDEALETHP